jgi:hypothetical protein
MINPLKVATGGYLKRQTKAVLIIAVAGYLNFQSIPPIPPSGGGGYSAPIAHHTENNQQEKWKERAKRENQFIIEFLKTATDIINNQ